MVPVLIQDRVLRDNEGKIVGMRSAVLDMTERILAENELRWRTAFFEALVNSSSDGIIVVNSEGQKILQNRRAIELWKIPEGIANDPDDSRQVQFVMNQAVDAHEFGEKVIYLYAHPEETSQDEIVLKDGTTLDRISAAVIDGHGHYFGRIWSFRDITDRKQAEEKLKKSISLLNATLDSSDDGILVVDLNNAWVMYNQRFVDLWRIPIEILTARDDRTALAYVSNQLDDTDRFLKSAHELYATPEA